MVNDVLAFINDEDAQMKTDFDSIVAIAADSISERDIQLASNEVDCQISGRSWNMNRPLNMIAYEDQQQS